MFERGGRERIPSRPISLLPRAPHLAASSLRVYHRHGGAARREPDQIILLKLLGIHPSPAPTTHRRPKATVRYGMWGAVGWDTDQSCAMTTPKFAAFSGQSLPRSVAFVIF
jgi:hypothetical protein